MSNILWDDVEAWAPELSTLNVDAQDLILQYVNEQAFSSEEWGGEDFPRIRMGRILLAAHFGTLVQRGATVIGPVVSESVGGVSTAYGNNSPMGTDPLYDKTSYGQLYRQLIRTSRARAPFVV